MKKRFKRLGAAALSLAMILGLMPGITKPITVQAANNPPTDGYWTDATGLKSFGMSSTATTIGRIKFGANNREWYIAGVDKMGTTDTADDTLALLSTTEFGTAAYGSYANYSASNFVNKLNSEDGNYLSTSYFSASELDKMQAVSVSTNEPNGEGGNTAVSVTDKKLYLPNSEDQSSYGANTIYVGSGNDIGIALSKLIGNYFWLRSPFFADCNIALVASPGGIVYFYYVDFNFVSVVPAFNLNLSSVIFASAAPAASSSYNGDKANSTLTANTYTVRYASTGSETAEISADKKSLQVSDASSGMYLMVQNSDGVYAVDASSNSLVSASSITIGNKQLTDFENCRVWLESTDSERITTAKLATEDIASVAVTGITEPTANSSLNITAACATTGVSETAPSVTWTPNDATVSYNTTYTASVTLTAKANYQFTESTAATINGNAATSVTKNQDGTLTVTYNMKSAAKTVSNAYFATAGDLKECYNLTDGTIAKIKFGANDRLWAICGADTADNTGNSLALLSTSEFTKAAYDDVNYNNKYSTSNFVEDIKKYTDNDNNASTYLGSTNFSNGELDKMQEVTVSTLEYDQQDGDNKRTETHKLYLPDAANRASFGATNIFVGTNNNIEIDVTKLTGTPGNGFQTNYFWLRSPYDTINNLALVASPGGYVGSSGVDHIDVSVVPAFNLNLSSVIFASAAPAASSSYNGDKANSTLTANTYTVRYASTGSETAEISADKKKISVSGASNGMYLAIQNSAGVYIVDASSNPSVNASSITIGGTALTDFDNCKVWLESTNAERITTAKIATLAQAPSTYDVTISAGNNMTKTSGSGEASQTGITAGSAMTDVVYTAASGYYFPTTYSVTSVNNINVTRNSFTQITVSGTPSATTAITLTAATEKATQNAPTGLSDGVDKIAGTTTAMEYASSADAASWNACTDGNTTVAAGTWYVRLKETDTKKASTSTSVVVTASQNPPTLYQVTVNSGSGDGTYAEGATVNITAATAPSGKVFDKWEVVSGTVTLESTTNATTTFTMPAGAVEVTATYKDAPVEPTPTPTPDPTVTITAGAGGTHQIGSDGNLQITCSGALADLTGIYVDGVLVESSNYNLKSVSTILTFTAAYLNSLSVGTHTVRFQYNNSYADTTFVITAADSTDATPTKDEVPKTGDNTPIVWLFAAAMISGAGVLYLGKKKKAIR